MTLEFFCSICTKVYENHNCIYTTHCGHVFHQTCLENWVSRSGNCPECRRKCKNASIFKLFIKSRNSKKKVEITKEPDNKVIKIKDLEVKLAIAQNQLMHEQKFSKKSKSLENKINEHNNVIRKLRADFEKKKKDDEESRNSSLQSPKTSTPSLITLTQLTPPSTSIAEKISEKSNPMNCTDLDAIAKKDQLIKELERKLSEKSLELEKEIRNSTMLIVEKMKLHQQLIDAGISAGDKNHLQASTNNLNHQVKKSLQNATVVPGSWRSKEQTTNGVKRSIKDANTTTTAPVAATEFTRCDQVVTGGSKKRFEIPDFDLFIYSRKLRKVGFKQFSFDDCKIYAWKDDASEKIQIFSAAQIEALLTESTACNDDEDY